MYTNHLIRNELWGMAIKIAQKSIRNNKLDTIANCQLGEIYLADKNLLKALNSFLEAENIIELSEKIKEIDESDESQIFLSDIQKKISEIYSALGEVELACLYINKAIHSLNNETRSKKREQLKVLYDIKEKYHN
jgi:tetratricopeptide (TPR) repeat protein